MKKTIANYALKQLSHLYISPLSTCNLSCKMCYTYKNSQHLSKTQIFDFVTKYQQALEKNYQKKLETITFCGGEVFLQTDFIDLLNTLTSQEIFIQIITNGTIDHLDKIRQPNWVNLIVSLDGLEAYHDSNRGVGNFAKSLAFLKKAQQIGFFFEIFSIVTAQNYQQIADFENFLRTTFGKLPTITYHPRKSIAYLKSHQKDNFQGQIKGFDFINKLQLQSLIKQKKVFPPKNLGCYQIAVNSDAKVYSCCEGNSPIGTIADNPGKLMNIFLQRLDNNFNERGSKNCLGCSEPNFLCGLDKNDFLESKHESK